MYLLGRPYRAYTNNSHVVHKHTFGSIHAHTTYIWHFSHSVALHLGLRPSIQTHIHIFSGIMQAARNAVVKSTTHMYIVHASRVGQDVRGIEHTLDIIRHIHTHTHIHRTCMFNVRCEKSGVTSLIFVHARHTYTHTLTRAFVHTQPNVNRV